MTHKKKLIISYGIILLVFLAIFFIAYLDLIRRKELLNIGLGYGFESMLIMALCFVSVVKLVFEIKDL
ncbi:hypothetical protein ACFL0W_00295 [Nanoarchaeota archaeon]